ncbi:MAG: bifunctional aconitate hydratase 2/2-methylisocitrate dehydratase [Succinivibrionaceae bacterium]|nr:bifunctional aconitate hydratase 2/2-methylisocitrate dehydratase [Succinivibrionaceae bacterium]
MGKEYLQDYFAKAAAREGMGIPPLPLDEGECRELCALLLDPPPGSEATLLALLRDRVSPGVSDAARVKAAFLAAVARGEKRSGAVSPGDAVRMLGMMLGGYNVAPLVEFLSSPGLAPLAVDALSHTLLVYDAFDEVAALERQGNAAAHELMGRWAEAEWFTSRPAPAGGTYTVLKVSGEVNTDDLSPAPDAFTRPDIPLHALAMLKISRPDIKADEEGVRGPISLIAQLRGKGFPLLYAGDVVGTGSSRKSGVNSLLWHIGHDLEGIPNKRSGGVVLGGKIAPIFYNTLEDSGALPIEADVSGLSMGQAVDLDLGRGEVRDHASGGILCSFTLRPALLDEVRAGGRIPLIIGRALTARARAHLGLEGKGPFQEEAAPAAQGGSTRAQKIIARAAGLGAVRPGQYCEVKVATVGSQDTTGPMTRDEITDLACLRFAAPLVMQSFCHTAAYPRQGDVRMHQGLAEFMRERGGVALRPGDGVIHSWLNRMCLPDTLGTGGDSHTRMPLGISFAAGSGLVAFAAATGTMPLTVPESVLVRFTGRRRPGITLRDLVHAIPRAAMEKGLLTVEKKGKRNIFSGKIIEIEGLEDLSVEHAFELCDASAERSAAACSIRLSGRSVSAYLRSNAALLRRLAAEGYGSREALQRRAAAMEEWLASPTLLEADPGCEYAAVLEIDQGAITEPLLCCPNDPDDVRPLSEIKEGPIDEIFIGSCMTNIGHYRAAAAILGDQGPEVAPRLWMAPPTRLDRAQLTAEGLLAALCKSGARVEIPGCSLCMGNQARVRDGATVVSTSTRNFPNRLGNGARVYLASAELAAVAARLGRLPSASEYFAGVAPLAGNEGRIYSLLDFSGAEGA